MERDWHLNSKGIFIKLLPDGTKDSDLFKHFSKFGFITEINVLRNPSKSRTVGCGFVTFLGMDSVRRVLDSKPHLFGRKRIIIRVAREKRSEIDGCMSHHRPRYCWPIGLKDAHRVLHGGKKFLHSKDDKLSEDVSSLSSDQLTIFVGCLKPEVTEGNLTAY
ncbi:unnamed protein product, partial [Dibothriocephalus latus]